MDKKFEIRDLIHGFISINEWEREIINHPVYQRLRRIKQLSLTDMVYPGACHTRFEHSLGVMHLATMMFECVKAKKEQYLRERLNFGDAGFERECVLIRLAALLHDVGHSPFSHAGEDLMPLLPESHRNYKPGENKRYSHEDYTIAIIRYYFKDLIEDHPLNAEYNITVDEVCAFFSDEIPKKNKQRSLLWKNIISSQLDADRSDYLLRDSKHLGVGYGVYDLNRLLNTLTVSYDSEQMGYILAIEQAGWHVAESLVIARYQMFSQVYFHKTRRIYDYHIGRALKSVLLELEKSTGYFPPPESKENINKYISYDDWNMYGHLRGGLGGEHGDIIINRKHYRCVCETSEIPDLEELDMFNQILEEYKQYIECVDDTGKGKLWYKSGKDDLMIVRNPGEKDESIVPLSSISSIVASIKPNKQFRMYTKENNKHIKNEIDKKFFSKRGER